ncbi:condensation domain-containing protein [Edwardsiella piscicida]|nr:condensation domain-containing protein [Edwardsiella piscicida]
MFADPAATHVTLSTLDASDWSQVERQVAEINAAFHLQQGPLLRALRFTLGDDDATYLYLCAHHLIVDGVSWRRIAADLQSYYEQGAAFTPAPTRTPTATAANGRHSSPALTRSITGYVMPMPSPPAAAAPPIAGCSAARSA